MRAFFTLTNFKISSSTLLPRKSSEKRVFLSVFKIGRGLLAWEFQNFGATKENNTGFFENEKKPMVDKIKERHEVYERLDNLEEKNGAASLDPWEASV